MIWTGWNLFALPFCVYFTGWGWGKVASFYVTLCVSVIKTSAPLSRTGGTSTNTRSRWDRPGATAENMQSLLRGGCVRIIPTAVLVGWAEDNLVSLTLLLTNSFHTFFLLVYQSRIMFATVLRLLGAACRDPLYGDQTRIVV